MAMLAHHLDVESDEDWTFAIAAPGDVRRLADATGFWYEWDRNLNQFDHPAMLVGIRSGRLVRLLVGGSVTSARLDELVREVSGVFVPSYPLPSRRDSDACSSMGPPDVSCSTGASRSCWCPCSPPAWRRWGCSWLERAGVRPGTVTKTL